MTHTTGRPLQGKIHQKLGKYRSTLQYLSLPIMETRHTAKLTEGKGFTRVLLTSGTASPRDTSAEQLICWENLFRIESPEEMGIARIREMMVRHNRYCELEQEN